MWSATVPPEKTMWEAQDCKGHAQDRADLVGGARLQLPSLQPDRRWLEHWKWIFEGGKVWFSQMARIREILCLGFRVRAEGNGRLEFRKYFVGFKV